MNWSPALIEDAAELISSASPADLDRLAQKLPTPLLRAALRVVALEALPNVARAAEALHEIETISDFSTKLHWLLRYLAAHPRVPGESYQQQVLAVRDALQRRRYNAGAEDLCRFLDLIAEVLPSKLESELEALLLSPSSSPEAILSIAHATKSKAVAELLLKKAEGFAAFSAPTEPTEEHGVRLRYSLVTQAVCRLCVLTGDLSLLERRAASLFPQEEDELRSLLASQLAELERRDPRQHHLSSLVCDGIQDPRRRLLTVLKISPPETLALKLEPASLYRGLSDVRRLEDEILGLTILQESPSDPLAWAQQSLFLFRETSHATRAGLRLALHTLRSQKGRKLALDLANSFLRAEDSEDLAKLISEVVELTVHASAAEEVGGEFQEAAQRIITMPFLSWEDRLDAFESLLATFRRLFLGETALLDASEAVPILKIFLRLPLDFKPKSSRTALRDRWPAILPMIIATMELFPRSVQTSCFRHFEASVLALSPEHGWFSAAFSSRLAERLDLAWPILEAAAPDRGQVTALVYLLARTAPDMAVKLLTRCLADKDRTRLCLRLLRHGWVSREVGLALRKLLNDEMDRLQADVWTFPRNPAEAEDWLRSLGALLGDLDVRDPRTEPLLRELWNCPPNSGHPVLAAAVAEVLKTQGRSQAESALRFWLHSFLAPSLGSESARGQMRVAELKWILRKAMTLPGT
jgi:hypothetical protein